MFFIRSAFWLTIAFLVIAPHSANDLGASIGAAKDQAIEAGLQAGQDLIVSQILQGDAIVHSDLASQFSSDPSVDLPMQDSSNGPVPFPRPRPDWMG